MTERVSVVIALNGCLDGSLVAVARATEPGTAIQLNESIVELSIWQEHDGLVRARLQQPESGALCYVQGNEALLEFGRVLGLVLTTTT